jgi:hypothetical protein
MKGKRKSKIHKLMKGKRKSKIQKINISNGRPGLAKPATHPAN